MINMKFFSNSIYEPVQHYAVDNNHEGYIVHGSPAQPSLKSKQLIPSRHMKVIRMHYVWQSETVLHILKQMIGLIGYGPGE